MARLEGRGLQHHSGHAPLEVAEPTYILTAKHYHGWEDSHRQPEPSGWGFVNGNPNILLKGDQAVLYFTCPAPDPTGHDRLTPPEKGECVGVWYLHAECGENWELSAPGSDKRAHGDANVLRDDVESVRDGVSPAH